MDTVSEIVFESRQGGTADAESLDHFEQQFVVNPVEGFSEVKIDSINLYSLIKLFAPVVKDLK